MTVILCTELFPTMHHLHKSTVAHRTKVHHANSHYSLTGLWTSFLHGRFGPRLNILPQ